MKFYKRKFLNSEDVGGVAFIEASAEHNRNSVEASLTIGDCSRNITLDFAVWRGDDEDQFVEYCAHIKQKLRLLRQTVVVFEKTVLAMLEEME